MSGKPPFDESLGYWTTLPVSDFEDLMESQRQLREALERCAEIQTKALQTIERNGFVFDEIGAEPGNWKHLAFSLYTDLCQVDSIARGALDRSALDE